MDKKTLYLVLENGKVFEGYAIGADGEAIGETVFQTSVLGYNEIITDPKFSGQIVVQTFPLIGNYGIISEELDSKKPSIAGYVVKSICDTPSNFREDGKLNDYLKANNIVGLCGIDTRELTRLIRDNGTMNGKITSDISNLDAIVNELKKYKNTISLADVSTDTEKEYKAENEEFRVCMYDFGLTDSFIKCFTSMGISVTVVPHNKMAEEVICMNPDGVVFSEGPGNPEDYNTALKEIKKIALTNIPIYACGLGHQLLAMVFDGKIKKHPYGHRGSNQPVKDTKTNRIYITSQNHGYIVDENMLPKDSEISFINVNDQTIEGIRYADNKAISTQFMPNLCVGPHDTSLIIDEFKVMMKGDLQ